MIGNQSAGLAAIVALLQFVAIAVDVVSVIVIQVKKLPYRLGRLVLLFTRGLWPGRGVSPGVYSV